MTYREIQREAANVSEIAVSAVGDENQGELAINNPEIAAIMGEWDQNGISSAQEVLDKIESGKIDELSAKQQNAYARNPEGFVNFFKKRNRKI